MDDLLTSQQVAERTGRKRVTVLSLTRRYGLGRKVGRDNVYTQADIDFILGIDKRGGHPPKSGAIDYKADPEPIGRGRPKTHPPEAAPS